MLSSGRKGVPLLTTKRLGERRRIPIQRIATPEYRRPMAATKAIEKKDLKVCKACEGAFLHYRGCPYFMGAEDLTIRAEAARAAKARMWA